MRHIILPGITLGTAYAAYIARLTRGGMLEVVRADFVRTARAKGLSEHGHRWRHMLRGGLLPVVTFLGPAVANLMVGSVVVEKIFATPGIGPYFVDAAFNRDYFLVMGIVVLFSVFLLLMNLWSTSPTASSTRGSATNDMTDGARRRQPPPTAAVARGTSLWPGRVKRLRKNRMADGSARVRSRSRWSLRACFRSAPLADRSADLGLRLRDRQNLALRRAAALARRTGSAPTSSAATCSRACSTAARSACSSACSRRASRPLIGTLYGAIAGYVGGRVDGVMMRFVDIMYALPYMFLVIVLVTIFPRSLLLLFVALGLVGWLTTARIVRGQVLSLKEREFVLAARSLGAGGARDRAASPDPEHARADHRLLHAHRARR